MGEGGLEVMADPAELASGWCQAGAELACSVLRGPGQSKNA